MNKGWMALCIVASLLIGGVAQAALLVDTGPGNTSAGLGLNHDGTFFQYLAGKFTLSSSATLDSVQGWMWSCCVGGSLAVKIRADGTVPGTAIFSQNYTLGNPSVAGWAEFTNFNVTLPAGTYWLSLEPLPGGGLIYSMPKGAPAPLSNYAFLFNFNPSWQGVSPNPGLGLRVSGTPVVTAPIGTASRTIVAAPSKNSDTILGGDDEIETYGWDFTSINGWAIGRGTVFANGVQAGAEAVNSEAYNAARAVAWRSFKNTTAGTLSFKVNATLDGNFEAFGGTDNLKAWSGIYALDASLFASTIAASGKTAEAFLLGGNALSNTVGAADRVSLAALFPVAARLGSDTEQVLYSAAPVSVPLQTGLISVAPNQVFTLMFDVSALASGTGAGTTKFLNTLEPAPVLFTDAGGSPVSGIQALGAQVAVGEASFLLWDDPEFLEWQPAVGAIQYRLYRGTQAALPKLLNGDADSCLRDQGIDTVTDFVEENPLSGTFYWYLAVGVNGSTEGSAGDATEDYRVVNSSGTCF